LPEQRDHLAAAELHGDLWVIAGSPGWFAQHTSTTLWRYDAGRDSWDSHAPLPLGRAAHAVATLNGKLYVVGGMGPEPQRLLVFDPIADAWSEGAPMTRPREHLAAAGIDGRVYVVGGRWGDIGNTSSLEAYDPANDRWRTLPPMPTARGGLAAAALNGHLYVTGGEVLDDSRVTFPQLEVFDPVGESWNVGPPLPTPRHGLAAVVSGGALYVLAGGRLAGLDVSGVVEVFQPAP
jgi:DNA-binding beta-propeller fold protein YncE